MLTLMRAELADALSLDQRVVVESFLNGHLSAGCFSERLAAAATPPVRRRSRTRLRGAFACLHRVRGSGARRTLAGRPVAVLVRENSPGRSNG
jgi:hypothetical protein